MVPLCLSLVLKALRSSFENLFLLKTKKELLQKFLRHLLLLFIDFYIRYFVIRFSFTKEYSKESVIVIFNRMVLGKNPSLLQSFLLFYVKDKYFTTFKRGNVQGPFYISIHPLKLIIG